jgi:hypothetical protein
LNSVQGDAGLWESSRDLKGKPFFDIMKSVGGDDRLGDTSGDSEVVSITLEEILWNGKCC